MWLKNMKDGSRVIDQNDALSREAWKKALEIFPVIRRFGRSIHNTGSIMEKVIASSVLRHEPIQFVGFWGLGNKDHPDSRDDYLLNHLRVLRDEVTRVYSQGAQTSLILADLHGEFNGFDSNNGYLQTIEELGLSKGAESFWLSDLYRMSQLALPAIEEEPDVKTEAWVILLKQKEQLTESASRHNSRQIDPERAAYHYVRMRLQEREIFETSFPDHILYVNGSKDLAHRLLPHSMPILYLRVGPVWFQKGEKL